MGVGVCVRERCTKERGLSVWKGVYLDTILGVVGALGEEGGGENGVGAEEGLADGGDGDHGGLLEDGGHDV